MSMFFKRIKDWAVSITSFRTGDVIPVDGPSGTAKMKYSDLAKEVIKDSANNTAATEADMTADAKLPIMTAGGPKALPANLVAKASDVAMKKNMISSVLLEGIASGTAFDIITDVTSSINLSEQANKFIGESGTIASTTDGRNVSEAISLDNDYIYVVANFGAALNVPAIAYYSDLQGSNYIEGINGRGTTAAMNSDFFYVVKKNEYKSMRIVSKDGMCSVYRVKYTSRQLVDAIDSKIKSLQGLYDIVVDDDVTTQYPITNGHYVIGENGQLYSTTSGGCTDVFPIDRSKKLCLSCKMNQYRTGIAFYKDLHGNVLDSVYPLPSAGTEYTNLVIDFPSSALSFRLGTTSDSLYSVHTFHFDDMRQPVSALNEAVFNYEVGESITESATQTNKALKVNGSLSNNDSYDVREFDVEGLEKVFVSGRSPGNASYCLAIAKNSDSIVLETYEVGTGLYYDDFLITLPENAKTLLVSNTHGSSYGANEANKVKNFYTKAEARALFGNKSNYWTNKKIWWCGTSIPAGGYPQIVGTNLGAEVTNNAVGGSMCRANVRTGDYVGANFNNITSALTMTKAEIEAFITNYTTIQPTLTGDAPVTLSASNLSRLRAASFEDRLIPYLDGSYDFPDLFVIDHGHNDFKYKMPDDSSDIGLDPTVANISQGVLAEDTYMTANNNEKLELYVGSMDNVKPSEKAAFVASLNRNCYKGAINFLVTTILHHNPFARIVFVSNYEYEHGNNPSYAPLILAQEDNANSWSFPLCEVYKKLGFSDHIIPGTKNLYPGISETYDRDVFKVYNPDGVHPHSQPSGITNEIYAGVLAEFLKTCR